MNKNFSKFLSCFGVSVIAGLPSYGAISLVGSPVFFTDGADTGGSSTISAADLGGFSASGVDKLVVTVGGEGNGNGATNNTVTGVTYGGVPMTQAVAGTAGNRRNSIWYLDDVIVSGDFVVSYQESQDGIGFSALSLNGTLPGAGNTADSGGATTVSLVTTTPGEFVVASMARNNFDELLGAGTGAPGGADPTTFGVQAPLTGIFYENLTGSSAASGYGALGAAGSYDLTIYENNGSGRITAAAFLADPIPEPSGALLSMLGVFGLLIRRR